MAKKATRLKRPSPQELAAAEIVVAARSAELGIELTADFLDTGPEQKMYDFQLTGTGASEALEITTLMDQATKTDLEHWQKTGPGYHLEIPGLTKAWTIMVDPQFNARALTKKVAEWLQALEHDQIDHTGRWDTMRAWTHPTTTAMAAAGVMIASSVAGPPPGTVMFTYPFGTQTRPVGDPNHITTVVTASLALAKHVKDAEKLDASGLAVRHLFLWVDPLTRIDIGRALDEGWPTTDPVVDPRITQLWLGLPGSDQVNVLRWSTGMGWQIT